ncbi:kinetochore scaffold 1 isoform X3 [Phyllopteryx taeniolatus]|uniref:kinetochore scaffold 1 isoform X3 n=1 Tax=Phyllopteryx taeniolatus TaxID=161469 RepID=UPI002AD583AD|nr:kinetochore scaffold 1 isoform X3 [Phyllopteryx taeniolatus]
MEPSDPGKNDENSEYCFRRRISSILKAPRKSIFTDPEQQENMVECAKPTEKRNSRRVSFAPANDVLLFAKDVKNASPLRSPFQELMSTVLPTQNSVQVSIGEDGIQQIMGMEPVISAPLHTSDLNGKATFEPGLGFGEKTVMYCEDDGFMEMTQSHTINIANNEGCLVDSPQKNRTTLLSCGKKTVMSSADSKSLDMSLRYNANVARGLQAPSAGRVTDFRVTSSLPSFDPSFNNLLCSLSESHGSNVKLSEATLETNMSQIKTQKVDVNKENQTPTSVYSEMGKSPNNARNIGLSQDMDLTVTHTSHITGLTDDADDPFQCLFPTQEMYSQSDTALQAIHNTKTLQKQTGMTPGSYNTKAASGNRFEKENAEEESFQITDTLYLKNQSFHALQRQRMAASPGLQHKSLTSPSSPGPQINSETQEDCREQAVRFTDGDAHLDVTGTHSVNIASTFTIQSHKTLDSLPTSDERTMRFTAYDATMDVTRSLTVNISTPFETGDQKNFNSVPAGGEKTIRFSANDAVMDMTQTLTPIIDTPFEPGTHHNTNFVPPGGEKNIRFSTNDTAMDLTQNLTANIATHLEPGAQQNGNSIPAEGEKTIRFSANDAWMDMTQNLTGIIDAPFEPGAHKNVHSVPTGGEKTMRFSANNAAMDLTQNLNAINDTLFEQGAHHNTNYIPGGREKNCFSTNSTAMDVTGNLTASIATHFEPHAHQNGNSIPAGGRKTIRFSAKDAVMDMTQSIAAIIDTPFKLGAHKNVRSVPVGGEKNKFSANDTAMEITQNLTAIIDTPFEPGAHHTNKFVPAGIEKTFRFSTNDTAMDVAQNLTANIATHLEPGAHHNSNFVLARGEKTIRFLENDAAMDVTGSLTANIATHKPAAHQNINFAPAEEAKALRQLLPANIDSPLEQGAPHNQPIGGETIRFSEKDTAIDMTRSLTVNIDAPFEPVAHQNVHFVLAGEEKMQRFPAKDAAMDVTQKLPANIDSHLEPGAHHNEPTNELGTNQNVNFIPTVRENCMRFTVNDAAIEVTQNNPPLEPGTHQNVHFVPAGEEKMQRFSAKDVVVDATNSLPANIDSNLEVGAHHNELTNESGTHQNFNVLPAVPETSVRFRVNDAALTVPQSHAINTATCFEPQTQQNRECFTFGGEKTIRLTTNDAPVDATQRHTVNIAVRLLSNEVPPAKKQEELCGPPKKRPISVLGLNPGQNIFCNTGFPSTDHMVTKADPPLEPYIEESVDKKKIRPAQAKTLYVDNKYKVPEIKDLYDSPLTTMKNKDGSSQGAETDININLTEVQTGFIVGDSCSGDPPQCESSTQHPCADVQESREMTSQQTSGVPELSSQDVVERIDSIDSKETQRSNGAELRNKTSPLSQKLNSPNAGDYCNGSSPTTQSRRLSLANLQLKLRRLSCMNSKTSDIIATESCTAPLPCLDPDADENTKDDKNDLVPDVVPDVKTDLGNVEDDDTQHGPQDYTTVATPFKFKTTELMSRLSMRGFKPKIPQRSPADEPKKANSSYANAKEKSVCMTATENITSKLKKWNDDLSDINDEVLCSCEELSETLDTESALEISENMIPFEDFNIDESLLDNVFQENSPNGAQGIKRPLPSDENNAEDKKKMKASSEMVPEAVEMGIPAHVLEYDRVNITTVPTMSNQAMDSSNSTHTNSSRYDPTVNSNFKQSMLESQLEDKDVQKLEDGTITMLEFFQLFSIDFVVHKPRQSVVPGRLPSDTDRSTVDVLKDRLINRPKEKVYESDFEILSEKVEGLNCRMLDLNKPLKMVNKCLWKEMKECSRKEMRSFGVKLKERNNFFRKMSKVRSHEMKEVLYSDLVQTVTDGKQKLRSTVDESNEMIKTLDDCICDLEAELAAVEEKGNENKPSLKSLQEEMKKVNETFDDKKRQIYELEVQTKQASRKLSSLKVETKNLQSYIGILNTINEWRFKEKTDNYTVYTFLYDTLHLQLEYKGNGADKKPEQSISHINFNFLLDDEKSQNHACMVHKLLSQYIEGETAWVEKYPTCRHVPKLLHDMSLVVSYCRLLGEELRLLKMWGGLRLNIVEISCVDTQINIVFSSLRRCSKFEVTLSVSLANHLYVLQVHGFKNILGDTTSHQIKQIVESFTPGKKLLTKIVKKINCHLLC